jgi:signal transduction histidine kinase
MLLFLVVIGAGAAEPKRVLFLHSYGREFAPWRQFSTALRQDLVKQAPWPIDLYEASVETARFKETQDEDPLVDYMRALFAGRNLDLIVTIGGPAARFFQRHRTQLFPSTPMLISGTEQRVIDTSTMTANDTAVPIELNVRAIIDNILRVLPETTNIAVVAGNSPLEKYWVEDMHQEFQPYFGRTNFIWLNDLPLDEIVKRVAQLGPQSAIFYADFQIDVQGAPYEQDKVLALLRAHSSAPIFSYFDGYLGLGIVGGPLLSVSTISHRTTEVAVRILDGEAPGDIKTPPLHMGMPIYDWRELRRWGISNAALPPSSIVRFREPSLWVRFRWPLLVIFGAMLVQGAIITWLLFERYRRRKAELESRARLLQVIHLNRSAAAGALSASVSHELNQPLGAILSNAEAAELLLNANPPDLEQVKQILGDIQRADQRAGEIVQHMRELLRRREKVDLNQFNLNDAIADALHILAPEARKRRVALKANGIQQPLPVFADRIHLQQVILNLAANGMDSMAEAGPNARELKIDTAVNGNAQVEVSVADTGKGIRKDKLEAVFDIFYTTKQQGNGLGLSIARTIVETYGGKIWAESKAGGGAIFRFTMPLTKAQPS